MPQTIEPMFPANTEQMSSTAFVFVLSKYCSGGVVRAREYEISS